MPDDKNGCVAYTDTHAYSINNNRLIYTPISIQNHNQMIKPFTDMDVLLTSTYLTFLIN